ncbi:MAG: hypothetical protein KJ882_01065 [Proteobacteria bacterium]|nr:hypothetical protein [Pseudomonadota bacterium]
MNLLKKREQLLKKQKNFSAFFKGSISNVCGSCQRVSCICKKTTSKRTYRLTYKDKNQKTKIVYFPQKRLREVKRLRANYDKFREINEQIMELNIRIFKESNTD